MQQISVFHTEHGVGRCGESTGQGKLTFLGHIWFLITRLQASLSKLQYDMHHCQAHFLLCIIMIMYLHPMSIPIHMIQARPSLHNLHAYYKHCILIVTLHLCKEISSTYYVQLKPPQVIKPDDHQGMCNYFLLKDNIYGVFKVYEITGHNYDNVRLAYVSARIPVQLLTIKEELLLIFKSQPDVLDQDIASTHFCWTEQTQSAFAQNIFF